MTIDEAIKHCEEKEKEQALNGCFSCAEEHKQLAEWLKELRKLKKCRECPLVKEVCSICGFKEGGTDCMDEDAKQASIPYTYNAPQHDWKCGYPDNTRGKKDLKGGAE